MVSRAWACSNPCYGAFACLDESGILLVYSGGEQFTQPNATIRSTPFSTTNSYVKLSSVQEGIDLG